MLTIRHYTDDDLSGVLSAWENATSVAHRFLPEDFLEQERYNIPNVYLPNTDTWVAEDNGTVIGFIALIANEVGAIFVEPDFHGRGIGRALMDKARQLHGDLEVEVFQKNAIGRQFYSSYGFSLLRKLEHEETGNVLMRLKYTSSDDSAKA